MSAPMAVRGHGGVSGRTVLLIVFIVAVTTFAVMNRAPVDVWPLGPGKPLILVIGISFVLGVGVGWLIRSLTHHRMIVEREVD